MELLVAFLLPVVLVVSSAVGWQVRRRLKDRHRSAETTDALRLVMTMLITFAALVLGLLTSSAKTQFDARRERLQGFGVSLIELDQRLREYGPDADQARAQLRIYVAAAVADSWPDEPLPPGDYPRVSHSNGNIGLENTDLGALLLGVDQRIAVLTASTPLQQHLQSVLETRMSAVLHERWQLVASSQSALAWPFLAMLMFWLVLTFAIFGLSTAGNRLVLVAIVLTAVSVAGAVYLIIDFNTPLTGLLALSSEPMRDALAHVDGRALPMSGR